jgi:hypothetical protein
MGFSLLVELLNMRYRSTRKEGPLDEPSALAPGSANGAS